MTSVNNPVEYLLLGHVSQDQTPSGHNLGGTVSYAGKTALSFDLNVGLMTACTASLDLSELKPIAISRTPSGKNTLFVNQERATGRQQRLLSRADDLRISSVPKAWLKSEIVHLAPIANEVEPGFVSCFQESFVGITAQGWMRRWSEDGVIHPADWHEFDFILPHANAIVLSIEDLQGDEEAANTIGEMSRIFALTRGKRGSTIYWKGNKRDIPAVAVDSLDSTGAGDIFATVFFVNLFKGASPWEAAQFATSSASASVARSGLDAIPSRREIQSLYSKVS
jgi:sugar/nucleoside kinase (ribokinase family)